MTTIYPQNKTDYNFGSNVVIISNRVIAVGSFDGKCNILFIYLNLIYLI